MSCSVALTRTHTYTLRKGNTPAWNPVPFIYQAETTSCWCWPALLFISKGLWSGCITLNCSTKKKKAGGGREEAMFTGVVPKASTPTTMTIIMMMMTKTMTQKNAVLEGIWPLPDDKKVTFGCSRMMRAVYVPLSGDHNFPLICRIAANRHHTGDYCTRHLYCVLWCFWCCSLIMMITHYYSLLERQPKTPRSGLLHNYGFYDLWCYYNGCTEYGIVVGNGLSVWMRIFA